MLEIPKKIITAVVQSGHVKLNGREFKVNKHFYWPWLSWGLWEPRLHRFFKNYVQSNKESIDIVAYFGGRSMLAEYKCGWQNRTGQFFDLILHHR